MRRLLAASAALLLTGGAAMAQTAPPDAASDWAEMQKCAALANDQARHACTDEVMRRAGVLASPEARAADRRKTFGDDTPRPRLAARAGPKVHRRSLLAAGGKVEKAVAAGVAAGVGDDEADADRISVTLQDVSLRGDGKLLLVTNEGVTWRPVEDDPIRPFPTSGEEMRIDRTVLGGYMCKLGKWTAFRCTRAP